jgi:ribonucleoside-diphosphate reductase alpha chain
MTKTTTTKFKINLDKNRNDLLTVFGKAVLKDRYLLDGEDFQDLFARVSSYYADNEAHAQQLYDYMSNMWFIQRDEVNFSDPNTFDHTRYH